MEKRVAIIGAGCSGLAAIKCCLDEKILPVCFEKENDIGGIWNYSQEIQCGTGNVYKTCTMNTCRDMMCFSDFPVPDDYPVWMKHEKVNKYFNLYADHFNLRSYIRFQTVVEHVTFANNYESTGKWRVTSRSPIGRVMETFDAILVCSGHHSFPNFPQYDGLSDFPGKTMHSHGYRNNHEMHDKNVLIVGMGNSAVDIAVDACHVASQVFISTRRGAWVIGRKGLWGLPADAMANSRMMFSLPKRAMQWAVEKMANLRFDHKACGLSPKHRAFESHPTINDQLPLHIMNGSICMKPDIKSFSQEGFVTFEDSTMEKIDIVVFATGYKYKLPFVDPAVTRLVDNKAFLYKNMFPPNMKHSTFAIIGLIQVLGALMPISEMQCRWFARVMKGIASLPNEEDMIKHITEREEDLKRTYYSSKRHTIQAFWIEYMDDIAKEIGVKPNMLKMARRDPKLAYCCFFGPCLPAQYRLQGPGKWSGARATIIKTAEKYIKPSSRKKESSKFRKAFGILKYPIIIARGIHFYVLLMYFLVMLCMML